MGHYIWSLQKIGDWMMAKMGHNEEFLACLLKKKVVPKFA